MSSSRLPAGAQVALRTMLNMLDEDRIDVDEATYQGLLFITLALRPRTGGHRWDLFDRVDALVRDRGNYRRGCRGLF